MVAAASSSSRGSDHPEATEFIKSVIKSFGFMSIYLGSLAAGGRLLQAGSPLGGRAISLISAVSESVEEIAKCEQR